MKFIGIVTARRSPGGRTARKEQARLESLLGVDLARLL
jgi:hypothetical protein